MLTKFKKSFTIALAVVMCLTTVCASAASWRIRDYVTTAIAGGQCPIQYAEYDDMGNFTGRVATGAQALAFGLKPFATVEHKNPWIDIYFPNQEFATIYADGKNLGVFAPTTNAGKVLFNGDLVNTGLVEYKDVDYMWQVAAPFQIYSITKAKLNIGGKAQWFGTPEFGYPTNYTGRNAEVKVQRVPYGFAGYEVTGANKIELVPGDFGPWTTAAVNAIAGVNLAPVTTWNGDFAEVSPAALQILPTLTWQSNLQIPRSYDYALVGPAFDELGNAIAGGKTITATTYEEGKEPNRFAELSSFGVTNLLDTVVDVNGNTQMCEITWTAGGYDIIAPTTFMNTSQLMVLLWMVATLVLLMVSTIGDLASSLTQALLLTSGKI